MEMEALYSDGGIVAGFTMPRPHSCTNKASGARSVSLKTPFPVIAGRSLCLIASVKIDHSCLHDIAPFTEKPMGKRRVSSLWWAFGEDIVTLLLLFLYTPLTFGCITVTRATTANVYTRYVITHTYSNKGLLTSACMCGKNYWQYSLCRRPDKVSHERNCTGQQFCRSHDDVITVESFCNEVMYT